MGAPIDIPEPPHESRSALNLYTSTSPAEAQRAMVMNNKHMGNRYVELFGA